MEVLLAHCAALFSDHGGMGAIFFIGGLTGGFTHCLFMCGPFVACERMCSSKKCSKSRNITSASDLKYHLGRMTTYGALGFTVALFSKQISGYGWWPLVSSMMLAGAGIMFLFSCFKSCWHGDAVAYRSEPGYLRGVLLGFMPCGLLYAALMMAATLANPVAGMFAMWLFTLGTVPALLIASGGAEFFSRKWQPAMRNAGRAVMAFNGLSLIIMAARIMK
jgi:sulfite exporter TauE/SafE